MTKNLFDLSTREFVFVLLGYSPKERFTIIRGEGEDSYEQVFEGTYWEIVKALSSDQFVLGIFDEGTFDYNLKLDLTDTVSYLSHRTNQFMPDLTQALYIDITDVEKQIFAQIEADFQDKNEFERWKESHTSSFYKAKSFLQSKCVEFKQKGLISFHSGITESNQAGGVNGVDAEADVSSNPTARVVFRQLQGKLAPAQKYLEALFPRYVDQDFRLREDVTNYHAYWIAYVIKTQLDGIFLQSIGDLFGIANIRIYKQDAERKNTYRDSIFKLFRDNGPSVPPVK